jgi:hypothetical protein
MKHFLKLIFICLLFISHNGLSQSKKVRFGPLVSITFPSEPYLDDSPLRNLFEVTNEHGTFQAMYIKDDINYPVQYAELKDQQRFYYGFLDGMIKKMNGSLLDSEFFSNSGYTACDALISFQDQLGNNWKMTLRVLVLNEKVYTASYANLESEFDLQNEPVQRFFDSWTLHVKSKSELLKSAAGGGGEETSLGKSIWKILIALVVVLSITVGAIFIATRKSKVERAREADKL